MQKPIRTFVFSFLVSTVSPWAAAAADADHFQLTPTLLAKFESIEKEMSDSDDDQSLGGNAKTPDDLARRVAANPKLSAALRKGGVEPREFALATFAMLHAGTYLMTEQMNKAKAETSFASFTKEQQANVRLLRSRQKK